MTDRYTFKWLPAELDRHGVEPRGVLHVGAHVAQEKPIYDRIGFRRQLWVEPNPDLAAALIRRGLEVLFAAVGSTPGSATLHIARLDEASSLLEPIRYRVVDRVEVPVVRIDSMDLAGVNVLVVDAQGSELDALRSADLSIFDALVVETAGRVRYRGQSSVGELVEHLRRAGFEQASRHRHGVVVDRLFVRG